MNPKQAIHATARALTALAVCVTVGCSKNHPNQPGPGDGGGASATIGPSGGTLETDGFMIAVPAGAFAGDATLTAAKSDGDNPFGENGVTGVYRVSGLPEVFNGLLRISLRANGDLSDQNGIAIGIPGRDIQAGDSVMVYSVCAADDSAGYLVTHLGLHAETGAVSRAPLRQPFRITDLGGVLNLVGFNQFQKTTSGDHFEITHSALFSISSVQALEQRLEILYQKVVSDLNLPHQNMINSPVSPGWDPYKTWDFPIRVHVMETGRPVALRWVSAFDANYPYSPWLNVSERLLGASHAVELDPALGCAILETSITTYYPGAFWWLNEAVAAWSEEFFSDPASFERPGPFPGNEMAPFQGMEAGWKSDYSRGIEHGPGMAAVLKYLTSIPAFGIGGISKTYQAILNGENHIAALLRSVDELPAEWWPEFFRNYIGGRLYGVEGRVFTDRNNLSGAWSVNRATDTLKVFSSDEATVGLYPDLSCKLFKIDIHYADINETAGLLLQVQGNAGLQTALAVLVFAEKDGKLEPLNGEGDSRSAFEIPRLRDCVARGETSFLVAVVNANTTPPSYEGTADIDLTLRIRSQKPAPDFNRCGIVITVNTHTDYTTPDTSYERNSEGVDFSVANAYPGNFTGNTFAGSYSYTVGTLVITGILTAELNADHSRLINVQWSENRNVHFVSFSGTDIPLDRNEWGTVYQVKGAETCNHITSLSSTQSVADGLSFSLRSHECGWNSKIWVNFSKE